MDHYCHLYYVFAFVLLSCLFLAALWTPAGKGRSFGSLVCDVYFVLLSLPIWYPGSGMELNCIDF